MLILSPVINLPVSKPPAYTSENRLYLWILNRIMVQFFSIIDLIIAPLYLIIIYLAAKSIQQKKIVTNPSYRFFMKGLMVKVFGGIAVCFIYVYYYGGGDTLNYYNDCHVLVNLFLKSPVTAFQFLLGPDTSIWYSFDSETGWPIYFSDVHAIIVVKYTWLLCLISFKSYLGMTMLLASISYWPIWRLYQTLIKEFPKLSTELAYALLFIPSVFFWGSGLLKDTITFASVCLFASSYSILLIQRKEIAKNIFLLIVASILLVKIKPYIFFALIPGSILWFGGIQLSAVKNSLVKGLSTPFLILFSLISGYFMLSLMSVFLGDYTLENVLDKAIVTQQDLKSEIYGGSSFDIGDFDPTVQGILSKLPLAINAALFRPYLWEVNNLAMFVSGLENFILLVFSVYLLIKLRVYNLFRLMFRHRILFFTVYFSMFFAFSVGLTTSNFGSLVRYKIPAIPFFVISLFIIWTAYKDLKKEDSLRTQVEIENDELKET